MRLPATIFFLTACAPAFLWAGPVDFQRDVQPLFAEYCLECHGPDKAKGGLALNTREATLKELKSGDRAVVPGHLEDSALLSRLVTTDDDEVMPPKDKAKRPKPAEIETLRRWVAEGAPWGVHWAYRPIARPPVPGPGQPIDAFVRDRLAAEKIAPSPEADRFTLIKRVSYDLLGLPPTPEEVAAFVKDEAPDAYARLVDRTLASPHYGERWGRHWLDQARYADSDGYEKDSPRPDAWRYRDWVIESFNHDQPFDQFTIEQLAGDLLPNPTPEQILATAFHRQTLTNREGGVDQEQFRVEAVFDRTETTGSVWLAHTVGCARCHNHKYDQISQAEYYRLFAFFNNADEGSAKVGLSRGELNAFEIKNAAYAAKLRELQGKLANAREPLTGKIPAWEKETLTRLAAVSSKPVKAQPAEIVSVSGKGRATTFQKQADGSWLVGGKQENKDGYTMEVDLPAGLISGLQIEVLPDESLPKSGPGRAPNGNFVLTELAIRSGANTIGLHSPKADFSQKGWDVAGLIDSLPETGWGILPQVGKAHQATVQFVHPIAADQPRRVTITLAHDYTGGNHAVGRFRFQAMVGESEDSIAPANLRNLVKIGAEKWTGEDREKIVEWLGQTDPEAATAAATLASFEAGGPKQPVMDVRVIKQRKQPRETHIFHRGEFLSPTDPVTPGTLGVLPPLIARNGGAPDRLDLARWLISRENPLPARVAVNQIWMRLFGEGLVRTAADFGVRGDRPSHPELLDWLASEFVAQGWSRKTLIREIMLSETYRQSSDTRAELNDIDPRNVLLARQNRLRVEGEVVRDLHLAAAGLLSSKIGGPSVYPPMPPEIAALSYAGNFRWKTSEGADRYRRGMYTFFKRTAPYPDLMTFDCPDANVASIRRTVSNTPLQALTTLNADTFNEAARVLATRTLASAAPDDSARIVEAFQRCLVRPARKEETTLLLGLLRDARTYYSGHADDAKKMAGALAQGAVPELAAWTTVTRILLNTDEFITRE